MAAAIKQDTYYGETDFDALAERDADFHAMYNRKGKRFDPRDGQELLTLTKALLRCDFGLELELPEGRLCPPVPIRWNYVHWLQSILDTTQPTYDDTPSPSAPVFGLDIGTGASGIYTLLAARSRPNWYLHATDIDPASATLAQQNIDLNSLQDRCIIYINNAKDPLIPLDKLGTERLDFTICNPPFFASLQEMEDSLTGANKRTTPSARCNGAVVEMVTEGGDLGFVSRMIDESLVLRDRVRWYSSMFGHFSSYQAIVQKLRDNGITNFAVASLWGGRRTKRWAIAWSFGDLRPRDHVARNNPSHRDLQPLPTEISFPWSKPIDTIAAVINAKLSSLDLQWSWDPSTNTGIGFASGDVWGRHYRREKQRRERERQAKGEDDAGMEVDTEENTAVALGFKIWITDEGVEEEESKTVLLRWLRGQDKLLWEKFQGMVKRTIDEAA